VQFTDGICKRCARRVIEPTAPSPTPRRRGGDRAAALFVGLPLTAALVLAAAPLSESPQRPSASALPAPTTTASETRARSAGMEAAVVAQGLVPAAGGGRSIRIARTQGALAARAMVVVAKGVERVNIQTP